MDASPGVFVRIERAPEQLVAVLQPAFLPALSHFPVEMNSRRCPPPGARPALHPILRI